MREVNIEPFPQHVRVFTQSNGGWISGDRPERSQKRGRTPMQGVDGLCVPKLRIVRDQHHVPFQVAVEMNIDVPTVCRTGNQVR